MRPCWTQSFGGSCAGAPFVVAVFAADFVRLYMINNQENVDSNISRLYRKISFLVTGIHSHPKNVGFGFRLGFGFHTQNPNVWLQVIKKNFCITIVRLKFVFFFNFSLNKIGYNFLREMHRKKFYKKK